MRNAYKFVSFVLLCVAVALPAAADEAELEIKEDEYEVTVGDTVILEAVYKDSTGAEQDKNPDWSVEPADRRYIRREKLSPHSTRKTDTIAELDALADTAHLEIESDTDDDDDEDDGREKGELTVVMMMWKWLWVILSNFPQFSEILPVKKRTRLQTGSSFRVNWAFLERTDGFMRNNPETVRFVPSLVD
ncbi:MAG: hypothetical protein U5R06_08425 [candidate division KSB1 bacterium]|nr:hypothetical protein [candidate division KSB1 bacterium]